MAVSDLSAISELLKRYYLPGIIDQLNNSRTLYGLLEKSTDEVAGDSLQSRFAVKYRRNQGMEWIGESGDLPDAGNIGYLQGVVTLKFLYAALHLSAQAMYASRKSESAFATLLDESIYDLVQGVEVELERVLFGDGSGVLAQFNHATAIYGAGTAIGIDNPGSRTLERGMFLEAFQTRVGAGQISPFDTTNNRIFATVSQVDRRLNQVKFETAADVRDNYFLARKGSLGKVMMGIKGIHDFSVVPVLHSIDRSAGQNEWFRSTLVNANGNALTLEDMQGYVESGFLEGAGQTDCIITSFELRKKYMNLFVSDRRYAPTDKLVNGMTETVYMSGDRDIPIIASRFCDSDHMYFLDKDTFKVVTAGGLDWITADDDRGDVLFREPGKHEYRAYLYFWGDLICKAPNRNTLVTGLAI